MIPLSMFIKILCILLFIEKIKSAETNCKNIKPKSPTDCKLSTSDKTQYQYCCYVNYQVAGYRQIECSPLTDDDYQDEKSVAKLLEYESFVCDKSSTSSTDENTKLKNCHYISPKKASDCVLTEEDKKKYEYCCYEEIDGVKTCSPYTEESYKEELEYYNIFKNIGDGMKFQCGGDEDNQAGFINISIVFFILLIIMNL